MISVAMASYNGMDYIERQLDSIRLQTLPVDECVIVDDGSTDETVQVIENYRAKYPAFPIRFVSNKENMGYRKNFKEEELHYNKVNLEKLHYFVANRTLRPKIVIDGESEIMGALKSGNGDAFGF